VIGSLRVLVVEDEAEVRDLLAELIAADGHDVTVCANGAAALAWLEAGPADLVVTDLGMPGMSGLELAEVIRSRWPDVSVGMVTGWGETLDREQSARVGIVAVIGKPFRPQEIRAMLAATRQRADHIAGDAR
jgi:CheY-like chemotaxis protein